MSRITAKKLEAFTATDDGLTIRESGGLVGRVRAGKLGITVLFRYEFKLDGRKLDHRLGSWPKKSLAEIRADRDRVRAMVADGIDPTAAKKAARIKAQQAIAATIAKAEQERAESLTIQDLFDSWIVNGHTRKDQGAELRRSFEKDVLPAIGAMPVRDVKPDDIRALLRAVAARGVNRTVVLLLADIQQMFRWGQDEQPWRRLLIEGDPAKPVKVETLVSPDYDLSNERERILSPDEIRELRDTLARLEAEYEAATNKRSASRPLMPQSQIALWLCLSTMCRVGELLAARWEHIDFEKGEWLIPRANFKRTRGDRRPDFLIGLSDFALRQFKALHSLTGDSEWCFPARNKTGHVCLKSISKQVGDRQTMFKNRKPLKNRRNDDSLVLSDGERGEWTPHDLRRTGSTLMQQLGVDNDTRNRCLNHAVGSKIDRTYGVYDFYAEKREAWRLLGQRLDEILAGM